MTRHLDHLVIDDFLLPDVHSSLLEYALASREKFSQTMIYSASGQRAIDPTRRASWRCDDGLGPCEKLFQPAIEARFSELLIGLRIPAFQVHITELELTAHRNGSFFGPHIDTAVRSARNSGSDRVISTVYYFHTQPKRFSGGELAIAPLGKGEPRMVEPRDNRLVAFASFAPHWVNPVICEDDDFAHARFAVNCWLHRARNIPPGPELDS